MRLTAVALLLLVSTLACAQVILTTRPAPEIGEDVEWFDQGNKVPHTIGGYHGRVVLVDFWEYTCINCIRDFAVVKRWYRKYRPFGFEVIGVHFGEFSMGHNAENVRRGAQRLQLPWPVVADVHGSTWNAFQSNEWPNRYLIDPKSRIVMQVGGEGNNALMERKIQELLAPQHPEVKQIAVDPDEGWHGQNCGGNPTDETYVGDWFGRGAVQQKHKTGQTAEFTADQSPHDGRVLLSGRWKIEQEGATSAQREPAARSDDTTASLPYHATSVYAVLSVSNSKKPVRAHLQQDGAALTHANAGRDVQFDGNDSFVEISEPRMYDLVKNPAFGPHTLALRIEGPGLTLHSFTFGNNCQQEF